MLPRSLQLARPLCQEPAQAEEKPGNVAFCIPIACHSGELICICITLLRAIQVVFFCVSIGQEPRGLALGLVNYESEYCPSDNSTGCVLSDLGCRMFSSDSSVTLEHLNNEEEGLEKVMDGKLWGLLVIQEGFTTGLLERLGGGQDSSNSSNTGLGQVQVHMDMSNQQVALSLQRWVMQTLSNSTASLLSACQLPMALHQDAIVWKEPVYGENDPSFTEFMAPGIIILIIYFLAVALTGESFISERAGGLLERSWVAGVTPGQVLAAIRNICQVSPSFYLDS